ncbi:TRAP transporter large permease [Sneathiella chinensis]|uniref:TRAP transporter large permease protein n=1 Tax=Sneathiella chinensis TaxID=349750 RepID=A0ABQ5U030_9PROT|nr:TRAP transporter large permease [Sneathiella chinensis]GLQ05083.1 C4-dicarboxylate ABC transporter [Sneathiella chinensis]
MDPGVIGLSGFAVAMVLIALRVPIGFALAGLAIICTYLFFGFRGGEEFQAVRAVYPTMALISSNVFEFLHSYPLSMVPLFIALGHVAFHAGITTEIYFAVRVWLSRIPGGLAMASVVGCGGFSAITGSSVACASAMGRICIPEMTRFKYSPSLATSTVAVGGTLGALIPPSVLFIMYGLFTEQSVNKLFLAGVIPGLLSLLGFMTVIYIWARLRPEAGPVPDETYTVKERWIATARAWPALLLFVVIIGGIYGGIFTATEAAAVCLSVAIGYGVLARKLDWDKFLQAMKDTAVQSASIFFIAVCAKMFVAFVSLTGLTQDVLGLTEYYQMPNWAILVVIVLLYLLMGMFLDPLGIMLLTLPFVIPLVEGMGLDLIWFGVVVVKLLEIGLITPPVGLNVFIISSVVEKTVPVHTIFRGVINFLAMDLFVFALIVIFPVLSLFLPNSQF